MKPETEIAETLKALREITPTVWESAQRFIITETIIDVIVVTLAFQESCIPKPLLQNIFLADTETGNSLQVFVDQFNNFLTREEVWEIAEKKNQIVRRCGGDGNKLFSENLY